MLATERSAPVRLALRGVDTTVITSWMGTGEGLMEFIAAWDEERAGPRQLYPQPPDWHGQRLCSVEDDPEFFGVDDLEKPALSPSAMARARSKCDECPIRRPCLTAALVNEERFGIWGGTSGRDRARMRARMRDGVTVGELVDEWLTK